MNGRKALSNGIEPITREARVRNRGRSRRDEEALVGKLVIDL